jgi:hypothetical protein
VGSLRGFQESAFINDAVIGSLEKMRVTSFPLAFSPLCFLPSSDLVKLFPPDASPLSFNSSAYRTEQKHFFFSFLDYPVLSIHLYQQE